MSSFGKVLRPLRIGLAGCFLCAPASGRASAPLPPGGTLIRRIEWRSEKLSKPAVVSGDGPNGGGMLTLAASARAKISGTLWTAREPGVHTRFYALVGKVRTSGDMGNGRLNLWSEFGGDDAKTLKNTYFVLAPEPAVAARPAKGASAPLTPTPNASVEWRPLVLPFDASAQPAPPSRLELSVSLPRDSTLEISDLALLEFANADAMWTALMSLPPDETRFDSTTEWLPNQDLRWLFIPGGITAAVVLMLIRRKRLSRPTV